MNIELFDIHFILAFFVFKLTPHNTSKFNIVSEISPLSITVILTFLINDCKSESEIILFAKSVSIIIIILQHCCGENSAFASVESNDLLYCEYDC